MTNKEIREWQQKEKAFIETDIGKAFNRFKKAHAAICIEDYNDNLSPQRANKLSENLHQAETEFKRLLGWGK
jgi:hypothetical protein